MVRNAPLWGKIDKVISPQSGIVWRQNQKLIQAALFRSLSPNKWQRGICWKMTCYPLSALNSVLRKHSSVPALPTVLCCAESLSRVWFFSKLWTVARQAPLSMGFFRQEYCSGLPCPPPRALPNPGIKPRSPRSPRQILHCCTAREALKKSNVSISKEANSTNQTEGSGKMHAFGLFQTFRRKLMCSLLPQSHY